MKEGIMRKQIQTIHERMPVEKYAYLYAVSKSFGLTDLGSETVSPINNVSDYFALRTMIDFGLLEIFTLPFFRRPL